MIRPFTPRIALASVVAFGIAATAAITITPASYDFGEAAVKGMAIARFRVALPGSAAAAAAIRTSVAFGTLTTSLTGPNAADFYSDDGPIVRVLVDPSAPYANCISGSQGYVCTILVSFRPQSLGPKTATLVVTDSLGNRATAQLKGKGVAALCEMKVVFCNYAHLYTGSFRWRTTLSGPASSHTETVDVQVIKGVATCNGAATDSENGQTTTGPITGTGLIAVEFERDDTYRLVYRITVACPSPAWPGTPDNPRGTPSRPAELGDNEQKSYDQPASGFGIDLIGSSSYPAPETDSVNGVSGQVDVSWSLKRS